MTNQDKQGKMKYLCQAQVLIEDYIEADNEEEAEAKMYDKLINDDYGTDFDWTISVATQEDGVIDD